MADLHIKVGGAWKAIDNASVKVSGAWKQVEKVYVKVSGAWKEVWTNVTYTLSGTGGAPNSSTGAADAGWRLLTDGTIDRLVSAVWTQFQAGVEWCNVSPPITMYVRATLHTGNAPDTGPTLGSWHALTSNRAWNWTTDTNSGILKLELCTVGDGTDIVAEGYYEGVNLGI